MTNTYKKTLLKLKKIPTFTLIGILGVILMYVGSSGIVSVTKPWTIRGDTMQHLDYTWRLYHGDIPRFEDRITYEPFVEFTGRQKPQQASVHPPLFYIIHAPFVGPLLDEGKWHQAIAVGRAVNVFIGVLCVVALAWGGWVFGKSRRAMFAVAVPALSVLMYRFVRLNVDYALDVLLVLFSTITLILVYKILQNGLKKEYLLAVSIISVLGMSTKAPYVVFLLVSLLGIVIAAFIHGKGSRYRKLFRGAIISTAIFLVVIISIGWFYYLRNYKSTGSLFSSLPADYTGGRVVQSFGEVITSTRLWSLFYGLYSNIATISIALTSFVAAGFLTMKRSALTNLAKDKPLFWALVLLGLSVIGIFATQVEHAVGIGSINFRYMLPALLPIGLFLAYGLLAFGSVRGQLVTLFSVALGASATWVLGGLSFDKIYANTTDNDIPTFIATLLIASFGIGIILLSISLFKLTEKGPARRFKSQNR